MDNAEILIDQYYQSLKEKNGSWKDMWSSDGKFSDSSQTLLAEGKEAVINSFTPFLNGVTELTILQRVINENSACYVIDYRYINRKQESFQQKVAEVWQTKDGKLKKLTIYFDLTAYRKFMQG